MEGQLGQALPRFEDLRLVRGAGRYTDDLAPRDGLWAALVRSPHAHAVVRSVDVAAAAIAPGVHCALTASDYVTDGLRPLNHRANPPDAIDPAKPWFRANDGDFVLEWDQWPLVGDRVRFVGEAVAIVVAETQGAARDAAELVQVDYEALPVVVDAYEAMERGQPQLWEEAPGNVGLHACMGDAAAVDRALGDAFLLLDREFYNQRIVNCQMEPRSVFASYEDTSGFTIVAGGQGVVRQRAALARSLNVENSRVRLVTPDTGGGFGPRTALNVEPLLVAWAAHRLGRTVRWTSDRTEAFMTDYQGRDQWTRITLGFDRYGRILAQRSQQTGNLGAYPVSFAPLGNGQRITPTCYDIGAVFVETRGVLTNTAPTAPYRGAGRPEAHFAIERLLDMAASKLNIDRIEIRRRNLISRHLMPYKTATGLTYDSGDMIGNMEAALALADWHGFPERLAISKSEGKLRGIGVSNYVESPVGAQTERATITVRPDETIEIISGTQSTGQGHETTFVQVVAALLGLPPEIIRLRTGDTDFVTTGGGTHSDRSARLMGVILHGGCQSLIARGCEAAALLLGAERMAVTYREGQFSANGASARLTLFDVARALAEGALPTQMGTKLEVTEEVSNRVPAHPTGCAVCEVEVDPETGVSRLLRYCSVDDVGQPINPLVVDGQVHGGIAQGAGQALSETFLVDAQSGQVLGASFMDYGVMRADDLPSFNVALSEDPTTVPGNPLRIKGGGEGGITPATAVIVNALVDALKPYGIEHVEMPASPQRIWTAIRQSQRDARSEAA
jgi:carbon-monoxide dehydrogenase large subunit